MEDLLEIIEEQIRLYERPEKINQLRREYEKLNLQKENGLSIFLLGNAFGTISFVKDSYGFKPSNPHSMNIIDDYIDSKMRHLLQIYQNLESLPISNTL